MEHIQVSKNFSAVCLVEENHLSSQPDVGQVLL